MSLFDSGLFSPGLFSSSLFSGMDGDSPFISVHDFLQELYNDELSDLFIGNRNSSEESREKLLPLIHSGLLYAYAKYRINLKQVGLTTVSSRKTYTLSQSDVLQITNVISETGRELSSRDVQVLNRTLVFTCPKDAKWMVEYKVRPPRMTVDQDDKTVHIILPDLLVVWLKSHVASRIYMAQKNDASMAKGEHLLMQAAMWENLYISANTSNEFTSCDNHKLKARGFE